MSEPLKGRVAIVTGAGGGLGRSHALELARRGAAVVVNDFGVDLGGSRLDESPGRRVVDEIEASGGRATLSRHDVADWQQAEELVATAIETFGDLHILVNNAGFIRDRMLANMSEDEWDDVVRVHLKGHAATSRHATAYWRDRAKASGAPVSASVVHTTAASGFMGAFGQANYSAAKMGILGLSRTIATECDKYGVRSNVISPLATTRMSAASQVEVAGGRASELPTAGVSAVVAWLSAAACPVTDQILHVYADRCLVVAGPTVHARFQSPTSRWTDEELDALLTPDALLPSPSLADYFDGLELTSRRP